MRRAWVLSHDSAAHASEMAILTPEDPLVHVTRPGWTGAWTEFGVKHHLARYLPEQVVEVEWAPHVLDLARTAVDIATGTRGAPRCRRERFRPEDGRSPADAGLGVRADAQLAGCTKCENRSGARRPRCPESQRVARSDVGDRTRLRAARDAVPADDRGRGRLVRHPGRQPRLRGRRAGQVPPARARAVSPRHESRTCCGRRRSGSASSEPKAWASRGSCGPTTGVMAAGRPGQDCAPTWRRPSDGSGRSCPSGSRDRRQRSGSVDGVAPSAVGASSM